MQQQEKTRQAGRRLRQVQALLLPQLTDDDAGGPHPQRLLHQPAQRGLAGALEVGKRVCIATMSGSGTRSSKTFRYVVTQIMTIRGPVFGRRTWQQACP